MTSIRVTSFALALGLLGSAAVLRAQAPELPVSAAQDAGDTPPDASPTEEPADAGVPDGEAEVADAASPDADVDAALAPPEPEVVLPPVELAPAPVPGAIEVQVQSSPHGPRDALVRSTEAVTVVKLDVAKRRASDMGDVLNRTAGTMLLRSGGLGSYGRFSMNGLYDDQIRFFLDGVPLEFSGFTQGIANIPPNLFEKVVVYRAVLPIRLGSDALGGAVNLVTDDNYLTGADGSYQRSSFGTHRATLSGTYRHEPTGFVVRSRGYFDDARNDYEVDVELADDRGRLSPARVKRFHDSYRAYGVSLEAGVVDKSWAKALLVRGFHGGYDADLQSNRVMTVPYGEVEYGERTSGVTSRYENTFAHRVKVEAVANYTWRRIDFVDDAPWVYDWRGRRLRPRPIPGEIENRETDRSFWDDSVFGRLFAEYTPFTAHTFRFSMTPSFTSRTGDERLQANPNGRDPLTAKRNLFKLISGLEYEGNAILRRDLPEGETPSADDYLLRNTLFGKSYLYRVDSEDPLPGGRFAESDLKRHEFGVGDALRYSITRYLSAKASYELTARLPNTDEVFGNGVLIAANLGLLPETSHNLNVGPRVDLRKTLLGDFVADMNFFLRDSRNMIVLIGNDRLLTYQNVLDARSLGLEGIFEWTSPGRYVGSTGGFTYLEQRNTSTGGTFGATKGDRIPSRPWLTSFWTAQLHFEKLLLPRDALEPYYYGRFVHEFYRGWESQGSRASKAVVPTQITHALGVSYYVNLKRGRVSATTEVQNLTDERVFDLYGVQRPGRAYFLKIAGEI